MKSIRGNFSGDSLSVSVSDEQTIPELGPHDVLIKVKACAVDLNKEKVYHQLLSSSIKDCPIGRELSGEIIKVGPLVDDCYKEGMSVVGIVPLDCNLSGCSEMCVMNQFDITEKPSTVSHEVAAAAIGAGLSAYTAIHYLGHVTAGDTVLVLDGATPQGYFTIQAAQLWGAKVLSTYKTLAERQFLELLKPPVAQLIELTQRSNTMSSSVTEETGGMGVDCVVDNGVRLFTSEEDIDLMEERHLRSVPHKVDIIACLGFSGKWITSHPHLQLDPPDSEQLFLRGASVSFLFPPAWTLTRAQHGRYHHILKDIMERLAAGQLKCSHLTTVPLIKATETLLQKDLDSTKCIVVIP
ncbi:quinone oxidoreductase-like protein 1 [Physella acuta]|uniref:quinone oxidoreductase-like protein 1 n=1 Tax=Physella acuta TaxID=109671 RepID=UPI0027DCBDEF|nr:quinone oxidoreductase-like protein 1 [Physella acuta]